MHRTGTIVFWILLATLAATGAPWLLAPWLGGDAAWITMAAAGAVVLVVAGHSWRRRRERQRISEMRDSALW